MVDFEMFTDEGNEACTQAFQTIYDTIFGDKFISEGELKGLLKEQIIKVAIEHGEVHDTEPEWHMVGRVNLALETKGYAYRVSRSDL